MSDLGLLSSARMPSGRGVRCICELLDGSFVSGSYDQKIHRWNEEGKVHQTFIGHMGYVNQVMELKPDVMVSSGKDAIIMWTVSTGERCRIFTIWGEEDEHILVKLEAGMFVSGSSPDGKIRIWTEGGECTQTINTGYSIDRITRLRDGSIVTATDNRIEVRKS